MLSLDHTPHEVASLNWPNKLESAASPPFVDLTPYQETVAPQEASYDPPLVASDDRGVGNEVVPTTGATAETTSAQLAPLAAQRTVEVDLNTTDRLPDTTAVQQLGAVALPAEATVPDTTSNSAREATGDNPVQARTSGSVEEAPSQPPRDSGGGDVPADPPDIPPPGAAAESPDPGDKPGKELGATDPEIRGMLKHHIIKAHFVKRYLDSGEEPPPPPSSPARDARQEVRNAVEGAIHKRAYPDAGGASPRPDTRQFLENVTEICWNVDELMGPESGMSSRLHAFLTSSQAQDSVATQEMGHELVSSLVKGTKQLDMVDLVVAVRAETHIFGPPLVQALEEADASKVPGSRVLERANGLREAIRRELVQAVSPHILLSDEVLSLARAHTSVYGSDLEAPEAMEIEQLQVIIRDRLAISDLVIEGGLWTAGKEHGDSEYSKPLSKGELNRLNKTAADTLQRLHLTKAYGVTPFGVSGDRLRLPWDVAVVPPFEMLEGGIDTPKYAEGALADFLFLPPDPERSDIRYAVKDTSEQRTDITVGGRGAVMRFRLHDDGRISHGLKFHNVPSDATERCFTEISAGLAFQELRGLFIALAGDALMPDDVIGGQDVRGSVAKVFAERPKDSPGSVIGDLLLRRRKALQRADVREGNRQPKGWEGPKMQIGGYFRRLPEGTRARPDAPEDAREYYESIGITFEGLPEGHTFVNAHDRTTTSNVTYRVARFRKSSSTAEFLDSL